MGSKSGSKGFTMVEVIVVLVVLAVLAAIAVPTFTGFIKKSEDKKAIADCKLCVAAAQDLINQHYMEFADEEDFERIVSPAKVATEAGVDGTVQRMYRLPRDTKSLMHLQFVTKDQSRTVQFCLLSGEHENSCRNDGENYKIIGNKTDSELFEEAFNHTLNYIKDNGIDTSKAMDSSSINTEETTPNKITGIWNSMSSEMKEFLKDKTWRIQNTTHGMRIFFTKKLYTGPAEDIVIYKYDLTKGFQYGTGGKVVLNRNGNGKYVLNIDRVKWSEELGDQGWSQDLDTFKELEQ
ncbi:MAG: prepilin-type N-terminal cleavage/methylation domain-containing protein [Anaerovoracaceae bacterium]